jgi:hypothetical protein
MGQGRIDFSHGSPEKTHCPSECVYFYKASNPDIFDLHAPYLLCAQFIMFLFDERLLPKSIAIRFIELCTLAAITHIERESLLAGLLELPKKIYCYNFNQPEAF